MVSFHLKNEEDFLEVKKKAEELYSSLDRIFCPYLKEDVVFNSKGIRHLKFKWNQQARIQSDQYTRLKLFYLVPKIIALSHTLQGIRREKCFEIQNSSSKWKRVLKDVCFYEFIAIFDNVLVKIVVKQVEDGEKYFWSIIPFWSFDRIKEKRILSSRNFKND